MYTIFDDSSYSRSRDMIGAYKCKGFTWPDHAPFRDHLSSEGYKVFATIKFEVSRLTHNEDMNGDTKCGKWDSLGS